MNRNARAIGCAAIAVWCLSACGTAGTAGDAGNRGAGKGGAGGGPMTVTPGGPPVTPPAGPGCATGPARQAWAEEVSGTGRMAWRVQLPTDASEQAVGVQPVVIGQTGVFAEYHAVYGLAAADGHRRWQWTGGQAIYGLWAWHGTAVVLSGQVSSRAVLAGIDAATGAVRWTLQLPPDGLYGSQALTADGGLAMLAPDGTLEVADLTTGQVRWSRQPGGQAPSPGPTPVPAAQQEGIASPVAAGPVVVDAVGGQAIGYDSGTGAVRWTAGGLPAAPLLSVAAGLVLVTSAVMGGEAPTAVTALAPASGHVAWRFDVGSAASVEGAGPAGIAVYTSVPDMLYLVDPATGRARWKAATFADDAVPLITATDVIQPEGRQGQRIVDRVAATGAVRWSLPVGGSVPPSIPVLQAGSRVVTIANRPAATSGTITARDLSTGRPGWEAGLPAGIFVPLAVTPGGALLAQAASPSYGCPAGGAAAAVAGGAG